MAKTQKCEQVAYLYIKDQILHNQFTVDHHVIEGDISKKLDMSRSPIRSALDALEKEGLVISRPYRGYFIKEIPTDQSIVAVRTRYALILWYRLLDRMIKIKADGRPLKESFEGKLKTLNSLKGDGKQDEFYYKLQDIQTMILHLAKQPFLENEANKSLVTMIHAIEEAIDGDAEAFHSSQTWIYMYLENVCYLIAQNRFDDCRIILEMMVRAYLTYLPQPIQDKFKAFTTYELR